MFSFLCGAKLGVLTWVDDPPKQLYQISKAGVLGLAGWLTGLPLNYEGRTESHEQQFFCKVTCFIIDKPNTPP